jgi:PDZ domain-containing protein
MNQIHAALALIAIALATFATPGAADESPRGFLGVGLTDAPGTPGAQVGVIAPGGPAEKAGVRVGDVIVAVDGHPAANSQAVVRALAGLSAGQRAQLSILRDGEAMSVHAVMGVPPAGGPQAMATQAAVPAAAARAAAPVSVAPLKVSSYATFTEPSEHAFTMEIPSGWQATGSLMRRGALQISPFVRTLSPDRLTYLMVGEPTLLTYTPPNATTLRLGWREGSLHNSGLGGVSMLLRYIPGTQFAKLYGEVALGGLCPQLHLAGTQDRQDFVAAADQLIPTVIPSVSTGGEASFSCRHGGQDMVVRVDAVTRNTRDNVYWSVIFLRAMIAPNSQADAAQEVLKHMTVTFRYDPQWVQKQNEISKESAAAIQQQVAAAERAEQGVIQKLNQTDQNFQDIDDIVSGYSTYRDDRTGATYKLSNTDPGKWADDSGRLISTPDSNPPPWTPNVHALTKVD